jgi:hypothetical protein
MKRFLVVSLVSAVLLVVAATVLVTRSDGGSGGGDKHRDASGAERSANTSATRTSTAPTTTTPPKATAPAATATAPADDPHFVCPDGGMDAVVALERAWEDGHQPWLGSAPEAAAACTFGVSESVVEPVGPDRYRVTHTTATTSESAVVEMAQPLGPGTVWVAAEITYGTSGAPHAPCTAASILPVVANELEAAAGGALHIVSVNVKQCRNGYAWVIAVPDNARCGRPGGACVDGEQVFLADHAGRWSYLTSGSGIACEYDYDLFPALLTACRALGLRP